MSLALPRKSLTMIFAAASLAGASMVIAKPATAAPASVAPIAQSAQDAGLSTQVQWRRYGGHRGAYYGRGYGPRYGYYRRGNNWGGAAAAGIAGLATGAIIGGALSQPRTTYVEPGYEYGAVDAGGADYCAQRFRSYDPASGTYLGYDGLRHSCP